MRIFYLILIVSTASLFTGCIEKPDYPVEPVISNIEVNTTLIHAETDSLVISFDFTDGDGDLGTEKGDNTMSAFLIDTREGFVYPYKLPYIAQGGVTGAISGTVYLTRGPASDIFPTPFSCRQINYQQDTLTYQIFITDRAGNSSDTLETPPIIIVCQ